MFWRSCSVFQIENALFLIVRNIKPQLKWACFRTKQVSKGNETLVRKHMWSATFTQDCAGDETASGNEEESVPSFCEATLLILKSRRIRRFTFIIYAAWYKNLFGFWKVRFNNKKGTHTRRETTSVCIETIVWVLSSRRYFVLTKKNNWIEEEKVVRRLGAWIRCYIEH